MLWPFVTKLRLELLVVSIQDLLCVLVAVDGVVHDGRVPGDGVVKPVLDARIPDHNAQQVVFHGRARQCVDGGAGRGPFGTEQDGVLVKAGSSFYSTVQGGSTSCVFPYRGHVDLDGESLPLL